MKNPLCVYETADLFWEPAGAQARPGLAQDGKRHRSAPHTNRTSWTELHSNAGESVEIGHLQTGRAVVSSVVVMPRLNGATARKPWRMIGWDRQP